MSNHESVATNKLSLPARIGLILLVLLALRLIQTRIPPISFWRSAKSSDQISRSELRFTEIQKALPSNGRIGYVTDISSEKVLKDGDAAARYYLAQYSLAPLQVILYSDETTVIGDFREPRGLDRVLKETPLRIVRQFENGVFLLQEGQP